MTGLLQVDVSHGVAEVVIDHPPTNLVDAAFIVALAALLDELEGDRDVRVVVFSSADPDFFLMHGDVHGILAMPTVTSTPAVAPNPAAALFERVHRSHLVSIGVVDGVARGGGAEFLTALDLRYGSERAVLGQPEVAMGILPGAGGTARLPHLLGRATRARDHPVGTRRGCRRGRAHRLARRRQSSRPTGRRRAVFGRARRGDARQLRSPR